MVRGFQGANQERNRPDSGNRTSRKRSVDSRGWSWRDAARQPASVSCDGSTFDAPFEDEFLAIAQNTKPHKDNSKPVSSEFENANNDPVRSLEAIDQRILDMFQGSNAQTGYEEEPDDLTKALAEINAWRQNTQAQAQKPAPPATGHSGHKELPVSQASPYPQQSPSQNDTDAPGTNNPTWMGMPGQSERVTQPPASHQMQETSQHHTPPPAQQTYQQTPHSPAIPQDNREFVNAFNNLRAEIRERVPGSDTKTLVELTERMEAASRHMRDSGAESLRQDLTELRRILVDQNGKDSLTRLESGYTQLMERLDALSRKVSDNDIAQLKDRIDTLDAKFEILPSQELINQLGQRVTKTTEMSASAADVKALDAKLDQLRAGLDSSHPQFNDQRFEDLSKAAQKISTAVENILTNGSLPALEERVETLLEKLDTIGARTIDSSDLARLQGEVTEIRRILEQPQQLANSELDKKLDELLARLDSKIEESSSQDYQRIEQQLSNLSSKFQDAEKQFGGIATLENKLQTIEKSFLAKMNEIAASVQAQSKPVGSAPVARTQTSQQALPKKARAPKRIQLASPKKQVAAQAARAPDSAPSPIDQTVAANAAIMAQTSPVTTSEGSQSADLDQPSDQQSQAQDGPESVVASATGPKIEEESFPSERSDEISSEQPRLSDLLNAVTPKNSGFETLNSPPLGSTPRFDARDELFRIHEEITGQRHPDALYQQANPTASAEQVQAHEPASDQIIRAEQPQPLDQNFYEPKAAAIEPQILSLTAEDRIVVGNETERQDTPASEGETTFELPPEVGQPKQQLRSATENDNPPAAATPAPTQAPAHVDLDDDILLEPGTGNPAIEEPIDNSESLKRQVDPQDLKAGVLARRKRREELDKSKDFVASARQLARAASNEVSVEPEARPKRSFFEKLFRKKESVSSYAKPVMADPLAQQPEPVVKQSSIRRALSMTALVILFVLLFFFIIAQLFVGGEPTEETVDETSIDEPLLQEEIETPALDNQSNILEDPQTTGSIAQKIDARLPDASKTIETAIPDIRELDQQIAAIDSGTTPPTGNVVELPIATETRDRELVFPSEIGDPTLRAAVDEGDPQAYFVVASFFMEGRFVEKDMARAATWYEAAAKTGHAPSQFRLGGLYEKGEGVNQDLNQAIDYYQRAASHGNANAMHNLAVMFAEGKTSEPDLKSAATYFKMAAEHGIRDSQFNLGILYARGLGMPLSYEESYKWFAIAADQGDNAAAEKRDQVAQILDTETLARAKQAASEWTPKELKSNANFIRAPRNPNQNSQTSLSKETPQVIRLAQRLLNAKGFNVGLADGVAGAKTRAAIRAFQNANNLNPTGVIDRRLLEKLQSNS